MTARIVNSVLLAIALIGAFLASPANADHGRPWHWNRNSPTATAVAQVYFVDHTPAQWPVYTGVLKWDNRPNYYRPYYVAPGNCNNNVVHCVPVRTGNLGALVDGQTTWTKNLDGQNHVQHGSMTVTFNTYYSYTANQRESIVCHELGHAAGPLKEGLSNGSCMWNGAIYPLNPEPHDFDVIVNNYSH